MSLVCSQCIEFLERLVLHRVSPEVEKLLSPEHHSPPPSVAGPGWSLSWAMEGDNSSLELAKMDSLLWLTKWIRHKSSVQKSSIFLYIARLWQMHICSWHTLVDQLTLATSQPPPPVTEFVHISALLHTCHQSSGHMPKLCRSLIYAGMENASYYTKRMAYKLD